MFQISIWGAKPPAATGLGLQQKPEAAYSDQTKPLKAGDP